MVKRYYCKATEVNKKEIIMNKKVNKLIRPLITHSVRSPYLLGGGRWVEPPTKFSKGGGFDGISIFRGGLLGKRG